MTSNVAAHQAAQHDWQVSDFDFALPPELIAQHPPAERSGARLLDASDPGDVWVDRQVRDWPQRLAPGDLVVVNDTKVIKARLLGRKASGGAVECLVERVVGTHEVWAHLRASKSPRAGQRLHLGPEASGFEAEMLARVGPDQALFHLRFDGEVLARLAQFGHVPLPPYIAHADTADDEQRYQTIFAAKPGAVAAPTAALHLDQPMLEALQARGVAVAKVTLHVGAGTFQPVRSQRVADHRMHSEWFEVSQASVDAIAAARARGARVVAVGTTTLRALESAARWAHAAGRELQALQAETDIFITPGFEFRVVDALLTNFHLPRSTLLMLVSAFAGTERIRALYQHAVRAQYRFFSYGDAMWLVCEPAAKAPNCPQA